MFFIYIYDVLEIRNWVHWNNDDHLDRLAKISEFKVTLKGPKQREITSGLLVSDKRGILCTTVSC